jgi:glycosyltransferase involved in cell wall biosynthesis
MINSLDEVNHKSKKYKLTVIVLAYNQEKIIERALDGVLSQKWNEEFLLVIYEDFSTDKTKDMIEQKLEKSNNNSLVISPQFNLMQTGGKPLLGLLLPKIDSEYIAICDGDDFWADDGKIARQAAFLDQHREYSLVYENVVPIGSIEAINYKGGINKDVSKIGLSALCSINTSTVMMRNPKSQFNKLLLRCSYGDQAIWAMLSNIGKGKYLESSNPVRYTVGGGMLSQFSANRKLLNDMISLVILYIYAADKKHSKLFTRVFIFSKVTIKLLFRYFKTKKEENRRRRLS